MSHALETTTNRTVCPTGNSSVRLPRKWYAKPSRERNVTGAKSIRSEGITPNAPESSQERPGGGRVRVLVPELSHRDGRGGLWRRGRFREGPSRERCDRNEDYDYSRESDSPLGDRSARRPRFEVHAFHH